MQFAGFWVRVLAYIIDGVIFGVVSAVVTVAMGGGSETSVFGAADLVGVVLGIAFFAGFESSAYQATPGKMALGLIVTDANGGRISLLRAIGRYFAKILSALILAIGFIMVAFTDRKQGLHDMLASTYVVKGQPGSAGVNLDVFS